jgi:tRNA G18 (ribose-2'-O)-methylase SpoU
MERITSRQNSTVRRFRELARAAGRTRSTEILLDGAHLLDEALACAIPIEVAAFVDRELDLPSSALAHLASQVRGQGGRVLSVTDSVLAAMSPVQHPSGVVAIGHAEPSTLLGVFGAAGSEHRVGSEHRRGSEHVADSAYAGTRDVPFGSEPMGSEHRPGSEHSAEHGLGSEHPAQPLVLLLAGLQDPGNVGAIIRTAAASGATGVAAIEGTANPFGWKALRGAMGGTFRIPVSTRGSLLDAIAAARDANVQIVAAVPRDGTPLPEVDFRGPTALVLGGEGTGVSDAVAAAADAAVTIPMRRPIESLNVSIAAAVILYEAFRQRDAGHR